MAKVGFALAGRNDGRLYHAVVRGDFQTVSEELSLCDVDLSLRIGGKSFLRHAGERGFKRIADLLAKHGLVACSPKAVPCDMRLEARQHHGRRLW